MRRWRQLAGLAAAVFACAPEPLPDEVEDAGWIDAGSPDADAGFEAGHFDAGVPPHSELPANTCVRLRTDLPQITWENGAVYLPELDAVVQANGHELGSYAQTSKTWLHSRDAGASWLSTAPWLAPRRCLVTATRVDSLGAALFANGSSQHGTIPNGNLDTGYTRIGIHDTPGPWLYDAKSDTWEDTRLLPPTWSERSHGQLAYEPSSDVVVYLGPTQVGLYSPHQNVMTYRALPTALQHRTGHAIAADPVSRRVVVFGGSGPLDWKYVPDAGPDDAYRTYVQGDTWVYDLAADQWHEVTPPRSPPRGEPVLDMVRLPMIFHPPSGKLLLHTTPLDAANLKYSTWPDAVFWSFDTATEQWAPVEVDGGPAYPGLLTFDTKRAELEIVGGGRDGDQQRPNLSRHLYACNLLPSERPAWRLLEGAFLEDVGGDAVALRWPAVPGVTYDVLRAEARPVPGAYQPVNGAPLAGGEWSEATDGGSFAWQVVEHAGPAKSWALFNSPARPRGLVAAVEGADRVVLRWTASPEAWVAGYDVYRLRGAQLASGGRGTKLNVAPVTDPSFVDTAAGLADGVARMYTVSAVSRSGWESGPSPMAYSLPDPPPSLHASRDDAGFHLSWSWPAERGPATFRVYEIDHHLNTLEVPAAEANAWYASWKPTTAAPFAGTTHDWMPADDDGGRRFFYVRAVGYDGGQGFFTDIVAPGDSRFSSNARPWP